MTSLELAEITVTMPEPMAPEAETGNEPPIPTALACLAMIGRLLGHDVAVAELIRENAIPPEGVTTAQLIDCARSAGFQCKVLRLGFDELAEAEPSLPAIARFRDGSSMVLLEIRRNDGMPTLVLQDPSAEDDTPLVLDRLRFERAWTGDLILVRRRRGSTLDAQAFGWPLIRRLVLRERAFVRDLVLTTAALGFLSLAPVVVVQLLAQRVLLYKTISTLLILCIAFGVAIAMETAFTAMRGYILGRLSARTDARLSTDLFDRLLALPVTVVERLARGALVHRLEQAGKVRAAIFGDLLGTMLDLGVLVFFVPLMLYISPALTAIVILAALSVGGGIWIMLPRFHARVAAVAEAEERRAAFQSQAVVGARTIKGLALGVGQRVRWRRLGDDVAARRLSLASLAVVADGVTVVVDRLLLSGTLALGVYYTVIAGEIAAVGTLVAFYLLLQRLLAPVPALARLTQQMEETRRAVTALAATINQPGQEPRATTLATAPLHGTIAFSDVVFRYPGAVHRALRGVTFQCQAGTILGIMGRSGSGKSTIARLLLRLYHDHRGAITIDGIDIRDIDTTTLRRSIGVIQQDSFIFSGTIRENITAAKGDASFEEMTRAARLSGADEFIDRLPRGYETMIQEGSPNLSAGQRQRLALARTLITNPRILILDEALSALDGEIEARVLANLRQMAGERTIILVSHRLTSLMAADCILILEDGLVHDFGRHHELLERSDHYSGQWHRERTTKDSESPGERLLSLS